MSKSTIFDSAKQNVSKANKFTFILAKYLIPKNNMPYFYCWYAYFRWVDDLADSSKLSLEQRLKFVNEQINLVDVFYNKQAFSPNNQEELFLMELINFDLNEGLILKRHIIGMLRCIHFDIGRVGMFIPKRKLSDFFELEVLSYLNTFQLFCIGSQSYREVLQSKEGLAGKTIHVVRDVFEDVEENLFNFSKESIEEFKIIPHQVSNNIENSNVQLWADYELNKASNQFKEGIRYLFKTNYALKYRILVIFLCAKYKTISRHLIKNGLMREEEIKLSIYDYIHILPFIIYNLFYAAFSKFLYQK